MVSVSASEMRRSSNLEIQLMTTILAVVSNDDSARACGRIPKIRNGGDTEVEERGPLGSGRGTIREIPPVAFVIALLSAAARAACRRASKQLRVRSLAGIESASRSPRKRRLPVPAIRSGLPPRVPSSALAFLAGGLIDRPLVGGRCFNQRRGCVGMWLRSAQPRWTFRSNVAWEILIQSNKSSSGHSLFRRKHFFLEKEFSFF